MFSLSCRCSRLPQFASKFSLGELERQLAHTRARHLGVAERDLHRQSVEQACHQHAELVGVHGAELSAGLALADHLGDRVAPATVALSGPLELAVDPDGTVDPY